MTQESLVPSQSFAPGISPLPRCCPDHPDWPTLSQHLISDFPELGADAVLREVDAARQAVTSVALDPADAVATGELIARHQLMMLAGRAREVARLDPERHARGA